MGFIFLFIIIVLFLFRKQIGLWLLKRFVNKMNNQANNAFRQAQEQQQQRNSPHTHGRGKKKKIDPTVGEFVNFEEIKNSEPQEQKSRPDIKQESQIEDAVWEDIK